MLTRAALAFALLTGPALAQSDATRSVDGTLTYMQRIALLPDAQVLVEARGLRGALLGETRFQPNGAQVPLPFALDLPAGPAATIHATIGAEGGTRWISDPIALPAGTDAVSLGEILLRPYSGVATPMRCGDTPIVMTYDGEATMIDVRGETLRLLPVVAASGARFEAEGDPTTFFWSKGDTGLFGLRGEEFPECATVPTTYRAGGNEPFWGFTVTGDAFEFSRPGMDTVTGTVPAAVWRDGAAVWDLTDAALTVRMSDTLCRDTMTGMPHPETVTVDTAEGALTGCGGDPATLLTGREWVVEDVGGAGIIDNARVTMTFGADGSVSGRGGCNQYNAGFSLSGEGLGFSPAAATMMACEPALMNLEQAFFQALDTVIRFDIADTGALVLFGADGTVQITAFAQ